MSERQRYRVIEKIDSGGMAEIYKAKAFTMDGFEKTVAIKRILPSLCNRPKFVNMFLDEARLAMHLSHANIVQVFDVGRAQGTYFIVMEMVEGSNLRRLFQRLTEVGARFPVPVALFVITEALKGLAHAHERRDGQGNLLGIVHRDVSPPNTLVSNSGEVKITDFGLAKAVTQVELTDPGIVKGKFSYLSPEAVDGRAVDHRTDIFSIGVVLWELLANRRLFLGKTEMETVELVQKTDVPSLTLLNPDVTAGLDKLVRKSLHRDPRKRFHSAREMGDELMAYLFREGLKVTSYDLAEFVRSVFEAQAVREEGATQEHIGMLITDEILSLSMLRYAGQPLPVEGSNPIAIERIGQGGRITDEDLRGSVKGDAPPPATRPQGTALVEMLEGRETIPMSAVSQTGRSKKTYLLWVLLGILALGAVGAGFFFFWDIIFSA
ncbi:MAG: serine/threonine protein kinase [Deltaproteobacteria bacterium]|nr:serine/threonine protein kinase [Deltaproteobacteria bacterium]